MHIQISLRAMKNGKWRWQCDTRKSPSDLCTPQNIGGGIYDPEAIEYDTAAEAAAAAQSWAEVHQP